MGLTNIITLAQKMITLLRARPMPLKFELIHQSSTGRLLIYSNSILALQRCCESLAHFFFGPQTLCELQIGTFAPYSFGNPQIHVIITVV